MKEIKIKCPLTPLNRGSYMSAHVVLNLLNKLGKLEIKCEACRVFYLFFATSLINSIMQEHMNVRFYLT